MATIETAATKTQMNKKITTIYQDFHRKVYKLPRISEHGSKRQYPNQPIPEKTMAGYLNWRLLTTPTDGIPKTQIENEKKKKEPLRFFLSHFEAYSTPPLPFR
jgi:hypothetical protein